MTQTSQAMDNLTKQQIMEVLRLFFDAQRAVRAFPQSVIQEAERILGTKEGLEGFNDTSGRTNPYTRHRQYSMKESNWTAGRNLRKQYEAWKKGDDKKI